MADEGRAHPASPQKLARARARGDVAVSADWATAAVLAAMVGWAGYAASTWWSRLSELARSAWSGHMPERAEWLALLTPLGVLMLLLPAVALLATVVQAGFPARAPSGAAASNDDAEPGPRVSAAIASEELAIAGIKGLVLGFLLLQVLQGSLPGIMEPRPASELLQRLGEVARALGLRAALGIALLGVLDFAYRRWRRARRLRMTRPELQREQREAEGDPSLRREWRSRSRALQSQASLSELESASCVIAASGRAVALRYDPDETPAPVLWIKADGDLAEALLARAAALGLPVEPDAALAQDLFRLEPSEPIPSSEYASVAAILRRSAGQGTIA